MEITDSRGRINTFESEGNLVRPPIVEELTEEEFVRLQAELMGGQRSRPRTTAFTQNEKCTQDDSRLHISVTDPSQHQTAPKRGANIVDPKRRAKSMPDKKMDHMIEARVFGYEERELWGKKWIQYLIAVEFNGMTWEVSKRYSEFDVVHKQLEEYCDQRNQVGVLLPKLPPKTLRASLDPDFVEERRKQLNVFLGKLLRMNDLAMTPQVLSFLGALEDQSRDMKTVPQARSRLYLDKFMAVVNVGDIILFRTDGFLQAMHRKVLSTSYDHVGIVIRDPWHSSYAHSSFLLEATADGVRKYKLKNRLRAWHLSKAQLVVRRLHCHRKIEFLKELSAFLNEVNGKKYGLNALNMIRRDSVKEKDSYFCSEIVAMALKRVGLLDPDIPSHDYLPATFAAEGEINERMVGKARFGHEILITFKRPEVEMLHRSEHSASRSSVAHSNRDYDSTSHDMDALSDDSFEDSREELEQYVNEESQADEDVTTDSPEEEATRTSEE